MAVIDLAGKRKPAWDPAADAIWFSGRELAANGPTALFKVTTAGQQPLVRRESGSMTLHDVSRSGHMLVTRDSSRGEVFGRIYSENKERELGWLSNSFASDLSPDGATVLLSLQEEASGVGYEVYLRKTDGSAAVRLGEGLPAQFSPDGNWALTIGRTPPEGDVRESS